MAETFDNGRAVDLSFTIISVETFHLVDRSRTYWEGYCAQNRVDTDRFVLKPGWRTVYARRVETSLLKVTLSDGSVGWGEATEPICPEIVCMIAVRLLGPVLGGREWSDPAALWAAGYELNRGRGHQSGYQLLALAALDVAVWDALGWRHGEPVAALLSPVPLQQVPVYISGLRRESLAERVELWRSLVGEGVAGAKLFVNADTEATVAELDGLRRGVPGSWKLMVDALWSYPSASDAATARRRFADFDLTWFECPLVPEDLEGHRQLAAGGGTNVALGEHFFTHHQSGPWFEAGVMQVFQPDICRTGLSGGMIQCRVARAHGISVTPHMGSGSAVVQAAALSFSAAVQPEELTEHQFDLATLLPDAFSSHWQHRNGQMRVPQAPGHGVTIDEAALRGSCQMVESWSVSDGMGLARSSERVGAQGERRQTRAEPES